MSYSTVPTIPPQAIWIVEGCSGVYSDRREWPVAWRSTKEEALVLAQACVDQAKAFWAKYGDDRYADGAQAYIKNEMLDCRFDPDYNGVAYSIYDLTDDPKAPISCEHVGAVYP